MHMIIRNLQARKKASKVPWLVSLLKLCALLLSNIQVCIKHDKSKFITKSAIWNVNKNYTFFKNISLQYLFLIKLLITSLFTKIYYR